MKTEALTPWRCGVTSLRSDRLRPPVSARLARSPRRPFELSARIHALVQHPNDLDQVRTNPTVVDHVHGRFDALVSACVPNVEAANPREQLVASSRCRAGWLRGDGPDRCRDEGRIPGPTASAPPLETRRQDVAEIRLCRSGQANARHRVSERACATSPGQASSSARARSRRARRSLPDQAPRRQPGAERAAP